MRELFTKQMLTIEPGQAVSGVAKQEQSVRIVSGRAWVTVEGISHDYWLFTGDTLQVAPGLMTVIEADTSGGAVNAVIGCKRSALRELASQLTLAVRRFIRSGKRGTVLQRSGELKHCG